MMNRWFRAVRRSRTRVPFGGRRRSVRLLLETLEDRLVPALGPATWVSAGPAPVPDNGDGVTVSGSVNAIAVDPTNADRVFIASPDGGVWRTTNATSATPTWTPLTDQQPFLGTTDLAFSPLDNTNNTLFVGTGRVASSFKQGGPGVGLYKTTDAGDPTPVWTQLGQATFTGLTITSVVPTSLMGAGGQVLLVGTGASPAGGNDQAPATVGATGLYRSADGGMNWTLISGGTATGALPAGDISQIVTDNANPNQPVIYAAVVGSGVYSSKDGGLTWAAVNGTGANVLTNAAAAGRIRLAVHNDATNDVLYAGLIDPNGGLTGVFRSADQGADWASLGLPPVGNISGTQGRLHFSIDADPTDPNAVYIGGSTPNNPPYNGVHFRGVFAATGTTWDALDAAGTNNTNTHADSRNMVFDRNGNLLECDDGGVYRLSTPAVAATRMWTSLVGNLAVTETQAVAYDSVNHVVFGGAQDNGTPLQTNPGDPTRYTDASSGDGQGSAADNTSMPGFSIHYTSNQGSLFRSVYNGANVANPAPLFAASTVPLTVTGAGGAGGGLPLDKVDKAAGPFFGTSFVLNQVDPRRILFGTQEGNSYQGGFLYESMDQGNTLIPLGGLGGPNKDMPQGDVGAVKAMVYGGFLNGQGNADIAYVGTGGLQVNGTAVPPLLLRATAGGTFNPVTSYKGASVVALATDPRDWRILYVIDANGKVWRSANASDANTPFVDITANLGTVLINNPDTLAVYAPGANAPPVLFVGGRGGVAATADPTQGTNTAWSKFGTGLPNVLVMALTFNATDNVLAAATFGRGFWEVTPLSDSAGLASPVLAPATATATFTQGGNPVAVAPGVTVTDAGSANLSSATITLANPLDGMNEALAVTVPMGSAITAAPYNPTSGQLVLTGTDTLANYQAVLQSLTYADTATTPNQAARVISVVVSDGFASSKRATTTVAVNAANPMAPATQANQTTPVQVTGGAAPAEVNRGMTVTDPGSPTLVSAKVTITNLLDQGDEVLAADTTGTAVHASYDPFTGVLTLSGNDTVAHYQQVLDSVTYEDTADFPDLTPRVITVELNDGADTSLMDSFEVDLAPAALGPTLDGGASFTLDDVNENDANPSGTFVADLLASASPADAVSDPDPNAVLGIAVVGTDGSHGTWQFTTDGGTTWQVFDAPSASHATLLTPDDNTLVRFVPANDFNGTVTGGLSFRLWDENFGTPQLVFNGDIDGSQADTTVNGTGHPFSTGVGKADLTVDFVNQPPTFTPGPNLTVSPTAGPQTLAGWASRISAGAPNQAGETLTFLVSNNNNAFFAAQPAIGPDGTLTFTPAPGAAGTATVTVQLHNSGGTANGGRDTSAPVTFAITFPPATGPVPQPPPVAEGDQFTFQAGRTLVVGAGQGLLRAGHVNGLPPLVVVLDQGPAHGRLALSPDGSFTYKPDGHFKGQDSFAYRVIDGAGLVSGPAVVTLTGSGKGGKHHGKHAPRRHAEAERVFDALIGR